MAQIFAEPPMDQHYCRTSNWPTLLQNLQVVQLFLHILRVAQVSAQPPNGPNVCTTSNSKGPKYAKKSLRGPLFLQNHFMALVSAQHLRSLSFPIPSKLPMFPHNNKVSQFFEQLPSGLNFYPTSKTHEFCTHTK